MPAPKGTETAAAAIPTAAPLPAQATQASQHLHPSLEARAPSSATGVGAPGDAGPKMDGLSQTDAKLSPRIFFLKGILLS